MQKYFSLQKLRLYIKIIQFKCHQDFSIFGPEFSLGYCWWSGSWYLFSKSPLLPVLEERHDFVRESSWRRLSILSKLEKREHVRVILARKSDVNIKIRSFFYTI